MLMTHSCTMKTIAKTHDTHTNKKGKTLTVDLNVLRIAAPQVHLASWETSACGVTSHVGNVCLKI